MMFITLLGRIKVLRAFFLEILLSTSCAAFQALSNPYGIVLGPNIFWHFFLENSKKTQDILKVFEH